MNTHDPKFVYPLEFPEWLETWPLSTKVWCHWCCHPHNNVPVPLFVKRDPARPHRFYCQGLFCSFNCAKAYAASLKGEYDNHATTLVTSTLRQMEQHFNVPHLKLEPHGWAGFLGAGGGVHAAPARHTLTVFGGYLSIEMFRKGFVTVHPEVGLTSKRRWRLEGLDGTEETKDTKDDAMIRSMTALISVTTGQQIFLQAKPEKKIAGKEQEPDDPAEPKKGRARKEPAERKPRGRRKKQLQEEEDEPLEAEAEAEDEEERNAKVAQMRADMRKRHELVLEARRKKRIEDATQRVKQLNEIKLSMDGSAGLPIHRKSSLSSCLHIAVRTEESL